jgi:hypothetical protein
VGVVSGVFDRGLSADFFAELTTGNSAALLAVCRQAGFDVRLRDDYLNAYAAGRSVARLAWRRGVHLEIHRKYLHDDAFPGVRRIARGDYAVFGVTPRLIAQFADQLVQIKRASEDHVRVEERSEERLLRDNAGGGPFVCVDRQVGVPGTRRYVDVVGVLGGDRPSLVLVELKRDLDNRIQEVPAQVARYLEIFSPEGRGLRADVATSLSRVASQLGQLGFPAPTPAVFEAGMPVLGLVVLVRYNPRSELLARAHVLAAGLPQPVWLWDAADDQRLRLPEQREWIRMGAAR